MYKPKLSSTVSVVKISEEILEFFKTNSRQQIHIKVEDDTILNLVLSMDGNKSIVDLSKRFDVKENDIINLTKYLERNGILDNVRNVGEFENYNKFRRVIHFLSEFSSSHEQLKIMWKNILDATVLIVGMGAVGSWVASNLAQSGVGHLILMDNDFVDITNLHRQFSYTENDIGRLKTSVVNERIKSYNSNIEVTEKNILLDENSLTCFDNTKIDLIINCADKPTVDTTSFWIGKYAMSRNIPHIIGGGYNMHLSLIGQTIIPGKTACVNCFKKHLEEENRIDRDKVKKLIIKNRKIGSFAPMCTIIASMVGMEAIKVLSKSIIPANINRRGEFDIYNMDIKYKSYDRRDDCEWCGKEGKYYSL